jgi:hypothetical protein
VGTWGTGLFDDDLAADMQGIWEDAVGQGGSPSDATGRLMQELGAECAEDMDEGPVFWMTLASLQQDAGALDPEVKRRALEGIEPNLERWRDEATPEDAEERERVLSALRARLG